jgi:hypothetical protein
VALPEPDIVADWMVAHPSIARGRLLTASVHMARATYNLNRIIGYLDGGRPEAPYLGLGMKEVLSQLVKAVRALDMAEPVPEVPQSPWRTEDDLPGHEGQLKKKRK